MSQTYGFIVSTVVEALLSRGVVLSIDGDALRYDGPEGAISNQDLDTLKKIKHEVLTYIQKTAAKRKKMSFVDSPELLNRLLAEDIARGIDDGRSICDLRDMARILADRLEDAANESR